MRTPSQQKVRKSVALPDGSAVALIEPDALPDVDVPRNVYRLNADGEILWQISAHPAPTRPRTPFTNIYFDDQGRLMAFRFDCLEFVVDPVSGQAEFHDYLK